MLPVIEQKGGFLAHEPEPSTWLLANIFKELAAPIARHRIDINSPHIRMSSAVEHLGLHAGWVNALRELLERQPLGEVFAVGTVAIGRVEIVSALPG